MQKWRCCQSEDWRLNGELRLTDANDCGGFVDAERDLRQLYTRMKRGGNKTTDTQTKSSRVSWRKLHHLRPCLARDIIMPGNGNYSIFEIQRVLTTEAFAS